MRWRRRRPESTVSDTVDDFGRWLDEQVDADGTLTALAVLHDWARRWANDLEADARTEPDPTRRAYWAGSITALRYVADDIARGAFTPGGDHYDKAVNAPPPVEPPPGRRRW
jgi:hypothetical protein